MYDKCVKHSDILGLFLVSEAFSLYNKWIFDEAIL